MAKVFVIGLVTLMAPAMVLRGQQAALAERVIPAIAKPAARQLPVLTTEFVSSVAYLASIARVPMGIETSAPEVLPSRVEPRRMNRPIIYEGRSVGDVLNALTAAKPGYTWEEGRGIIHVAPATKHPSFLDHQVGSFELTNVNISIALSQVHRLFDPSFAVVEKVRSTGFGPEPGTKAYSDLEQAREEIFTRTFSLNVSSMSVREILDAIVLAHGQGVWVVVDGPEPNRYAGAQIGFADFLGGRYMLRARY